ncbi:MAG: methyltransferase domain-containing protein [Candidatus Deferrimicrobiaceae bacterium]
MTNKVDPGKRFKLAVKRNFDQSAGVYDLFEEKHHLFETLTKKLCEMNAPFAPKRVLDVGCGTGISTLGIYKSLKKPPIVFAIDISEPMLIKARERMQGIKRVYFVRGDAEKLSQYFHEAFDAVFYTASIFLLPNYRQSIEQACKLILPGGVLAISYYDGLFNNKGRNAISRAIPDLKYQYGTVSYEELMKCLTNRKGFKTSQIDYRFEITNEYLFDFLSIPAQSAGIYPKVPYIERIPLVRDLCDRLTERVRPLFMGWKFVVSRKEG